MLAGAIVYKTCKVAPNQHWSFFLFRGRVILSNPHRSEQSMPCCFSIVGLLRFYLFAPARPPRFAWSDFVRCAMCNTTVNALGSWEKCMHACNNLQTDTVIHLEKKSHMIFLQYIPSLCISPSMAALIRCFP